MHFTFYLTLLTSLQAVYGASTENTKQNSDDSSIGDWILLATMIAGGVVTWIGLKDPVTMAKFEAELKDAKDLSDTDKKLKVEEFNKKSIETYVQDVAKKSEGMKQSKKDKLARRIDYRLQKEMGSYINQKDGEALTKIMREQLTTHMGIKDEVWAKPSEQLTKKEKYMSKALPRLRDAVNYKTPGLTGTKLPKAKLDLKYAPDLKGYKAPAPKVIV